MSKNNSLNTTKTTPPSTNKPEGPKKRFTNGLKKFGTWLVKRRPRIRAWHIVVYVIILWAASQGVLNDYPAICQVAEINLRFWNWLFDIVLDILYWVIGLIEKIPFMPIPFVDWLKTIIG